MSVSKKAEINRIYSVPSIADTEQQALSYDEFQEKVHGPSFNTMRNKIVKCITVSRNQVIKVLDCGTGTGDIAIRVAKRFPKAIVIGIDASRHYLKVAKDKIKKLRLTHRIFLEELDLRKNIPRKLGKFDFVVSQYVFHYRFNRALLFKSIYESLDTPGKIIFGVSIPSRNILENSKWWLKKENNAFVWYKQEGMAEDVARIKARADILFLQKYALEHGVADPIESWIADLNKAGFKCIECVWKEGMDLIMQAKKA